MNINQLLALANECKNKVAAMDVAALDDWYEVNVGYRLTEDVPSLLTNRLKFSSFVAAAMFYDQAPEGVDTPGAEAVEGLLSYAIENGDTFEMCLPAVPVN